jgi:hypothetical protein
MKEAKPSLTDEELLEAGFSMEFIEGKNRFLEAGDELDRIQSRIQRDRQAKIQMADDRERQAFEMGWLYGSDESCLMNSEQAFKHYKQKQS